MSVTTLFSAKTSNGDSAIITVPDSGREYSLIRVYGTFGGCTVQASVDFDNSGTYCNLVDGAWTVEDVKQVYLKPDVKLKLTVSGAGGSTSIDSEIV